MNKNRQVNNINKTQFFFTIIPLIRELDGQTLKSTLQNREKRFTNFDCPASLCYNWLLLKTSHFNHFLRLHARRLKNELRHSRELLGDLYVQRTRLRDPCIDQTIKWSQPSGQKSGRITFGRPAKTHKSYSFRLPTAMFYLRKDHSCGVAPLTKTPEDTG